MSFNVNLALNTSLLHNGSYEGLRRKSGVELYIRGIILAVIAAVTIFGNTLIIVAAFQKRHLWRKTVVFLLNLNISDLLIGLVIMPFYLADLVTDENLYENRIVCTFTTVLFTFLVVFSQLSVATLAIERFLMLKFPLKHRRWFTTSVVTGGIASLPIMSAVLSIVPLLFVKPIYRPRLNLCTYNLKDEVAGIITYIIFSVGLPCTAVVYCSGAVAWVVWKRKRTPQRINPEIVSESQQEDPTVNKYSREIRVSVIILVVIVTFTGCSLPASVVYFCENSGYCNLPERAQAVSIILLFCRSAINPFIYGFFHGRLRGIVVSLLRCKNA